LETKRKRQTNKAVVLYSLLNNTSKQRCIQPELSILLKGLISC